MNVKVMAMMMVGVMMFSGCAVMMGNEENDATGVPYWLYGMGDNTYYQMGDGTTDPVTTPTQVGSFSNVSKVVVSDFNTFFIDDGKLYGIGNNAYNQINDVSTDPITTPTQVGSFVNVTDVACSNFITFFIDDGKLYGMGRNNYYQQGDGSTTNVTTPTQVGSFTHVTSVVSTTNTTFFIDDGKLYGMGRNNYYQQGDGSTTNVTTPTQVGSFSNVTLVVATDSDTFFIDDGKLYGMGRNTAGQHGNGSTTNVTTPTQVGSFTHVTSVIAGGSTFFIDDGKLYGMGINTYGQIGVPDHDPTVRITTPTQVGSFTHVTAVAASSETTFFIDDGKLYGMGRNNYYQQGDNTVTDVTTPKQIGDFTSVENIIATTKLTFIIVGPSTATIAISKNVDAYGSVTTNSVVVDVGETIIIDGNEITLGNTTVTATPTTDTAQYDYSFVGWYDGSTQLVGGETVTSDMTITATFARSLQEYTVTFENPNPDYGTVSEASVTVDYGSAISESGYTITIGSETVTATPTTDTAQYDYMFAGWIYVQNTVTSDMTIRANFERNVNSYEITWVVGLDSTSEWLEYGTMPTHEDPAPPEGYLFAGWSPEIASVTGDQTYTAVFEEIVYITVTFDPNGGQLEGSTTKTVGIGTPYGELPTPKKDNYKFLGWYTDPEEGTLVTADTIVPEDAGTTLYAHWELTGFAAMLKPLLFLFPLILLAFLAIALVRTFA